MEVDLSSGKPLLNSLNLQHVLMQASFLPRRAVLLSYDRRHKPYEDMVPEMQVKVKCGAFGR